MTNDFFRARISQIIDLRPPLAVLIGRMPWALIEVGVMPLLAHKERTGRRIEEAVCSASRSPLPAAA